MPRRSAGILLYRRVPGLEVLLGHLGGPVWAKRQDAAWSIPKGEYVEPEGPWEAACREWSEELGLPPPTGPAQPLGEVRQSGGKVVVAWAMTGDLDPAAVVPGCFEMEWPPRSGVRQRFPELDRVEWCAPDVALSRLVVAQRAFVDRLWGLLEG